MLKWFDLNFLYGYITLRIIGRRVAAKICKRYSKKRLSEMLDSDECENYNFRDMMKIILDEVAVKAYEAEYFVATHPRIFINFNRNETPEEE